MTAARAGRSSRLGGHGPVRALPVRGHPCAVYRSAVTRALPAVIPDADTVSVWDFQGAIAPDLEVLTLKQAELEDRFDDLYARLNPAAAAAARQNKIGRLQVSR